MRLTRRGPAPSNAGAPGADPPRSQASLPPELAALLRMRTVPFPEAPPPQLVLTSGVPRSGTSWLDRIARAVVRLSGAPLSAERDDAGRLDDFPTNEPGDVQERRLLAFVRRHRDAPTLRCAKTHFVAAVGPEHPAIRVLYAWRDPRDVLISSAHYALAGPAAPAFAGQPFDAVLRQLAERLLPAIERSLKAAAVAPPSTLTVRYARLRRDPAAGVDRIAGHLGLSLHPVLRDAVVEATSFRRESGRPAGEEDRSSYHRKGSVGDGAALPADIAARVEATGWRELAARIEARSG